MQVNRLNRTTRAFAALDKRNTGLDFFYGVSRVDAMLETELHKFLEFEIKIFIEVFHGRYIPLS